MFGIKYIQFDSMTYAVHYKKGVLKREGKGLSFYYFSPNSSLAAIPLGSKDLQFIFHEMTNDFQTIVIQGQITFKISKPKQLAELLDFTINNKKNSKEDNFEKIFQRLNNEAQTSTSSFIQNIKLKQALRSAKEIGAKIYEGLTTSESIDQLGVEVINVDVVGISPTPEMAKALETETREELQKEADQAIYERRNFAVEQERRIKESELNTEIAVQEKRKQIQEKEAEIKIRDQENQRILRELEVNTDISVEESKQKLTEMKVSNLKEEAEAKGYLIEKTIAPYKNFDWRQLMALSSDNNNAKDNIAIAFRELAENSSKIGSLNITPDLLQTLMEKGK
jgi:regulator of protease activity HflC (stomatin/prohibitin superfamily)